MLPWLDRKMFEQIAVISVTWHTYFLTKDWWLFLVLSGSKDYKKIQFFSSTTGSFNRTRCPLGWQISVEKSVKKFFGMTKTKAPNPFTLKHSHYKNDATQLKKFLGLKLPPFFPSPCRWRKKAAISKSRSFSTELRRSYIDCTLVGN